MHDYIQVSLARISLDFSRLRTLRELSLRKTMASVADALLISPSAVSQKIALLEMEVGIELVERRGRGVSLTPAGARLAHHASSVIAILEEARTDLAELKRIVAGDLHVSAFPSVAASLIPSAIMSLAARYPALRTSFVELEPADGLAALRAWQTDIAIVDDLTTVGVPTSGIELIHLLNDRLYVLMSRANPLSERPYLELQDLQDEKFALDNSAHDYSAAVIRFCREAGFDPIVNGMCHGFEVVRALSVAGCSISIQPGLRVFEGPGDVCVREIRPAIMRKISAAYRVGELRNPAVKAFMTELKAVVETSRETRQSV
jgi:DNA-binding transcriptional LysR family regulator